MLKHIAHGSFVGELQIKFMPGEKDEYLKLEKDGKMVRVLKYEISKTSGEPLGKDIIMPNQSVIIRMHKKILPRPNDGHLYVGVNPELFLYGQVNGPVLLSSKQDLDHTDNSNVFIRFDCKKKVDISKFDYLLKIGLML